MCLIFDIRIFVLDCGPGLKCFQRYFANLTVPGCEGGERDPTLTDYCVLEGYIDGTLSESPTAAPTIGATTAAPIEARIESTTDAPSATTDVPADADDIPPFISCDTYPNVNFYRMCKKDSCCESPRSSTEFCHESYATLGDDVESACHHCCEEKQGAAKKVGPDALVNFDIAPIIGCDAVFEPDRTCRGCCDESGQNSEFCQQQYGRYSQEEIESICVSQSTYTEEIVLYPRLTFFESFLIVAVVLLFPIEAGVV